MIEVEKSGVNVAEGKMDGGGSDCSLGRVGSLLQQLGVFLGTTLGFLGDNLGISWGKLGNSLGTRPERW